MDQQNQQNNLDYLAQFALPQETAADFTDDQLLLEGCALALQFMLGKGTSPNDLLCRKLAKLPAETRLASAGLFCFRPSARVVAHGVSSRRKPPQSVRVHPALRAAVFWPVLPCVSRQTTSRGGHAK